MRKTGKKIRPHTSSRKSVPDTPVRRFGSPDSTLERKADSTRHQIVSLGRKVWFCPYCDQSIGKRNKRIDVLRHLLGREETKNFPCTIWRNGLHDPSDREDYLHGRLPKKCLYYRPYEDSTMAKLGRRRHDEWNEKDKKRFIPLYPEDLKEGMKLRNDAQSRLNAPVPEVPSEIPQRPVPLTSAKRSTIKQSAASRKRRLSSISADRLGPAEFKEGMKLRNDTQDRHKATVSDIASESSNLPVPLPKRSAITKPSSRKLSFSSTRTDCLDLIKKPSQITDNSTRRSRELSMSAPSEDQSDTVRKSAMPGETFLVNAMTKLGEGTNEKRGESDKKGKLATKLRNNGQCRTNGRVSEDSSDNCELPVPLTSAKRSTISKSAASRKVRFSHPLVDRLDSEDFKEGKKLRSDAQDRPNAPVSGISSDCELPVPLTKRSGIIRPVSRKARFSSTSTDKLDQIKMSPPVAVKRTGRLPELTVSESTKGHSDTVQKTPEDTFIVTVYNADGTTAAQVTVLAAAGVTSPKVTVERRSAARPINVPSETEPAHTEPDLISADCRPGKKVVMSSEPQLRDGSLDRAVSYLMTV